MIGDWGTRGKTQKRVAEAMDKTAQERGLPAVVLSTGDNVYPSGVKSAEDPLWTSTFENIYHQDSLQVPWWAVLGNHDHRGSISAQTEYSKKNSRWNLPSRYYSNEFGLQAETSTAIICLDTQQLLQRTEGWKDQLSWLEQAFDKHKEADYVIVNGHHPLRSYGHYQDQSFMIRDVKPLMDEYKSNLYVCGHDHDLQIIDHPDDEFACIVSGAGASCRSTAWGKHTVDAKAEAGFARLSLGKESGNASLVTTSPDQQGAYLSLQRRAGADR